MNTRGDLLKGIKMAMKLEKVTDLKKGMKKG